MHVKAINVTPILAIVYARLMALWYIDTYLTQSIVPAGTLVEPVQTTIVLWPSLTVADMGWTKSLSRGGRAGRDRTMMTAVRSAEPAVLLAIHLSHDI